jgi:hypothetical protein
LTAFVVMGVALFTGSVSFWGIYDTRTRLRTLEASIQAQNAQHLLADKAIEARIADQAAKLDALAFVQQGINVPAANEGAPIPARLGCLTDELVARIKVTPSAVLEAFDGCQVELRSALGATLGALDDVDYFAIFATLVSFRWAPYGAGSGITMADLQKQQVMQCQQYAALAAQLLAMRKAPTDLVVRIVGVDGGAVLNHAQIFYSRDQVKLLLDPTIGLVAVGGFDEVMRGLPVSPRQILDFYDRPDIVEFRDRVVAALTNGRYRPSDLLYYFEGVDAYLASKANSGDFLTPGGVRLRARLANEN